eukprot:4002358-Amphidinium_carterae.3
MACNDQGPGQGFFGITIPEDLTSSRLWSSIPCSRSTAIRACTAATGRILTLQLGGSGSQSGQPLTLHVRFLQKLFLRVVNLLSSLVSKGLNHAGARLESLPNFCSCTDGHEIFSRLVQSVKREQQNHDARLPVDFLGSCSQSGSGTVTLEPIPLFELRSPTQPELRPRPDTIAQDCHNNPPNQLTLKQAKQPKSTKWPQNKETYMRPTPKYKVQPPPRTELKMPETIIEAPEPVQPQPEPQQEPKPKAKTKLTRKTTPSKIQVVYKRQSTLASYT